MLTRRGFLGVGGLGLFTLSAGCYPPGFSPTAWGADGPWEMLSQRSRAKRWKHRLLGYPINMRTPSPEFFAWRKELFQAGIAAFAFNNVGDPFKTSPIAYNTHDFECEIIRRFGQRFGFPANDVWGFLSHSGTDSNLHGMYMGRTILQGRAGVLPKAYFSAEAHYSVPILQDLLGLEAVLVDTLPDGALDPDDLGAKLADHANAPALVIPTIGTTFKGAIDDVDRIQGVLRGQTSYVHVDAALFGGYLPFTAHAAEVAYRTDAAERSGRYDSIAVSCHKFFGFPSPAGLFLTRQQLHDEFMEGFSRVHNPEYIHHVPGTITCSRDAVKPAEFYHLTTPTAVAIQVADAQAMLRDADYLRDEMVTHLPQFAAQRANPLSNTVYFRHPGDAIVKKYSLATMRLKRGNAMEPFAHVVVMPHVTREVLAEFLADLERLSPEAGR